MDYSTRLLNLERRMQLLETLEVPGNFTAGSILFSSASGQPTQNNSRLFWDNTNERLVVGSNNVTTLSGQARFSIRGNPNNSDTGPHISTYTYADEYPLVQILSFTHDNMEISFDAYYDGGWKSSDAGSNFQIRKNDDRLGLWYDSGVATGSTITWVEAFRLGTTGDINIFQDLAVTGNVDAGTFGTTGTFTPTLKGTGTAGTFTYGTRTGRYNKIGDTVIFHIELQIIGITVAPTGAMRIGGLPFTTANLNAIGSADIGLCYNYNFSAGALFLTCEPLLNTTDLIFWETFDNANAVQAPAAGINTTFIVHLSGIYVAA